MLDMDTLNHLVGEDAITAARSSMDIESVSGFKLDKRGRIEGGVKPAPPSTEKPAYVRITKRGRKYMVDCRQHGRDGWCLHACILALHHLGKEPIYKTKRAEPSPADQPKLGMALQLSVDESGGIFRIRTLSTGGFVQYPRRYLQRDPQALSLPDQAVELLTDLAADDPHQLAVSRLDLAPLLRALWQQSLLDAQGQAYTWQTAAHEPPQLQVSVAGKRLRWRSDQPLPADAVYAPGWPGFRIEATCIIRYGSYLGDLQSFAPGEQGDLPLTANHLRNLLRQRHNLRWIGTKPRHITSMPPVRLQLQPGVDGLQGQLGLDLDDDFFPLTCTDEPLQILHCGNKLALLDVSRWDLMHLDKARQALKAPWSGGLGFIVRDHRAQEFLEETAFPDKWYVARGEADRWYGLVQTDMTPQWGDNGLSYTIDGQRYDHQTLMAGMQMGERGVRLDDGSRLAVDVDLLRANEAVLAGVSQLHDEGPARDRLAQTLLTGAALDEGEPPALPERWLSILRPYQQTGARWLLQRCQSEQPALLADDMGLGKTVQTLAFLDCVRGDLPQMVVVPTSLLANWQEECARFCPERRITLHHGPKRTKNVDDLTAADLVLTSYGTLRRDVDLLYDVAFQAVVLDEAQAIKNPIAQVSRAVCELWCHMRVALTGTPVENRLKELWSIFAFLAPGYLGDADDLDSAVTPGTPAFEALRRKVQPFMLRRLKQEAAPELPARQDLTVKLPLSGQQRALYDDIRRGARDAVAAGKGNTMSILTQLLRLRQACCHPGLLDDALLGADAVKVEFLLDRLAEIQAAGHAALVFSQFTQLLKLVRFALEEADMDYLYLDGQTRDRQGLVHRFQDGEAPVFLISLKAGGTGLNLTRASYVFHLDPWWNPMVEAQATDRAHRIGQTRQVLSYKLIAQDTVEERILRLQADKKLLAEGLWHDPDKLLNNLDKETLMNLLL